MRSAEFEAALGRLPFTQHQMQHLKMQAAQHLQQDAATQQQVLQQRGVPQYPEQQWQQGPTPVSCGPQASQPELGHLQPPTYSSAWDPLQWQSVSQPPEYSLILLSCLTMAVAAGAGAAVAAAVGWQTRTRFRLH